MKFKKIIALFVVLILTLCGCYQIKEVKPTSLTVARNEINLIINSERNLNDIVTLRFEPKNATERDISWSMESTDVLILTGSSIKANRVGSAKVTATALANTSLYVSVTINVYDPNVETYVVNTNEDSSFKINGLEESYEYNETVSFTVTVLDTEKTLDSVKLDGTLLVASNNQYSFSMPEKDVYLTVSLKEIEKKVATSVTLPSNLKLTLGKEDKTLSATVVPSDTTDVPTWSIIDGEDIISIQTNNHTASIHALKVGIATVRVTYNSNVSDECVVTVKEESTNPGLDGVVYEFKEDLGTGKRSKNITDVSVLKEIFDAASGNSNIITSVSSLENVYGAGYGGSGDNAWYLGNCLKLGTTSVNGTFALELDSEVNYVVITGYVYASNCNIQVGDSTSSEWNSGVEDGKTTTVTASDMTVVNKASIDSLEMSSITIYFAGTDSVKIAITNKKPLFITSIEFGYDESK